MAINIKEIFTGDSENQKIDKLNYNFDQILANGGGPIGATGAAGNTGATGADGAQGPIGLDGPQGIAGDYTDFFVVEDPTATNYQSIYTKSVLGAATNLTVGDVNADANGNIGVYGAAAIRAIGNGFGANVLSLDVDGVSGNYIDLNITDNGVDRILKFNPSATGTSDTSYEFTGSALKLISGGSTKVALGETESTFESDVRFNADVKLPAGASTGKVLTSQDSNGTFGWGDPGVVPIGTMVMVPGFVLQNSLQLTNTAPNLPIDSNVGAGIDGSGGDGGNWEGWYYCNGATWFGGGKQYQVPDMRDRLPLGFSYLNNSASTQSQSANLEAGTNNVEELKTITTSDDHEHEVQFTGYALDAPTGGGSNVSWISDTDTLSAGAKTIDISPQTTTVGYMIYLEATGLVFGGSQSVGPGGTGSGSGSSLGGA